MIFTLQVAEYVVLRLLRRYLFTYASLLRFGRYIPYFRVNANQNAPTDIADVYARCIREHCPECLERSNLRILEIGAGVTNSVGLLLAERLGCMVDVCDPYVSFDTVGTEDAVQRFGISQGTRERTRRIAQPDVSAYDVIVTYSVLEHINDPRQILRQLQTALRDGGHMIHRVDYRDHFFKYPFFFLMFSEFVWQTFLNPGDLYRWRLDDHLKAAAEADLSAVAVDRVFLPDAYNAVRTRMHDKFIGKPENDVALATIVMTAGSVTHGSNSAA